MSGTRHSRVTNWSAERQAASGSTARSLLIASLDSASRAENSAAFSSPLARSRQPMLSGEPRFVEADWADPRFSAESRGRRLRAKERRGGHWAIENSLHWIMDLVFRDDECRVRTENAPANFTKLQHMPFASRRLKRLWRSTAGQRFSTRIRAARSPAPSSRARHSRPASPSAWTKGAWRDNVFVESVDRLTVLADLLNLIVGKGAGPL